MASPSLNSDPSDPVRLRARLEHAIHFHGTVAGDSVIPHVLRDCQTEIERLEQDLQAEQEGHQTILEEAMHQHTALTAERDRLQEEGDRDHETMQRAVTVLQDRAEAAAAKLREVEQDRPRCQLCGGPHQFDTSIPSVIWNPIIRENGLPEFLCSACILREFVKRGESFTAELWGAEFSGTPIEVTINGKEARDSAKVSTKNSELRAALTSLREQIAAVEQGMRETAKLYEADGEQDERLLDGSVMAFSAARQLEAVAERLAAIRESK